LKTLYNAFLIIHAIVLRTTLILADDEEALVEFNPRDAGVKRGKFADLRRCIEQQVRRTDELKIRLKIANNQIVHAKKITREIDVSNKSLSKMLRRLEAETERADKDMKLKGKSKTARSRNSTAASPIKQTRSSTKESSKKRRSLTNDRSKSASKTAKMSEEKKWKRSSKDSSIEVDCDIPSLSIEKKEAGKRKSENSDDNEEKKKQLKTPSTGSRPRTVKRRASSLKERRFSQLLQSSDIADDNLPYSFA